MYVRTTPSLRPLVPQLEPQVLWLPRFRAPPRPHSRGTPAAPTSCRGQTIEPVQLLLSAGCVQSYEFCVRLNESQYALGLVSAR